MTIKKLKELNEHELFEVMKYSDEILKPYVEELDIYMASLHETMRREYKHVINVEDAMLELSTILYFVGIKAKESALKHDIAIALRKNKFNESFMTAIGTVAARTQAANIEVFNEAIFEAILENVTKQIEIRYESGVRQLDVLKKMLTYEIADSTLSGKVGRS